MNKEYIEREAIIQEIKEAKNNFSPTVSPIFDVTTHLISHTPAADVVSVVHGEWIPIVNYFLGRRDGRYYCSECRRVVNKCDNFCRSCGAKMDGGNKNG